MLAEGSVSSHQVLQPSPHIDNGVGDQNAENK